MSGRLFVLLAADRHPDQPRDNHSNVADACELIEHHQHPRRRSDGQDVTETGGCQVGEAQEE